MARRLRMLGRGGRLVFCPRNSAPVTWLTKETSRHHGSTIQWRGKSNAASAASDIPNSQRDHKKVSKGERRAMLESYVNKYREANAGSFPTPSKAKAEVGGSFYTARQIIQELKHYSNLGPSAAVVKAPTRKEPRKNRKSITVSEDMRAEVRVDLESEDVAESISFGGAMTNETLRDETAADHRIVEPTAEGINPDLVEAQSTFLRKKDQKIPYPPEKCEDAWKEAHDDQPKLVSGQNHVKEETGEGSGEDKYSSKDSAGVGQARVEVLKSLSDSGDPERQEKQYQAPSTFLGKEDQKVPFSPERCEGACKEAHDDQPKLVSEQNHVKEETEEDGGEDRSSSKHAAEVGRARLEVPKGISDSGGPQRQEKQYQASTESRDTETPQKSSVWRNLKLFADGILSIWRNR